MKITGRHALLHPVVVFTSLMKPSFLPSLLKYAEKYKAWWDGRDFTDTVASKDFADYAKSMTLHGKWAGNLELAAAARHWDTEIVVIPESAADPIYSFHANPAAKDARPIILGYSGQHYDYCRLRGGGT